MQLAITLLGKKSTFFIADVVAAITACRCTIIDLNAAHFSSTTFAGYLLVEGTWNCVAKLENVLDSLQRRLAIQIQVLHTDNTDNVELSKPDYIPYRIETIAMDQEDVVHDILTFLTAQHILVAEIKSSCYPAPYTQTRLLSMTFIVFIPPIIQLLSFRDDLFAFCENCNVDAIFEPIRR